MGFLSKIFGMIGGLGSNSSSMPQVACWMWLLDEPECPKSIIEILGSFDLFYFTKFFHQV